MNWLFFKSNPFLKSKQKFKVGDVFKIRRGLTNDRQPRFVLAEIKQIDGEFLTLQIQGTLSLHFRIASDILSHPATDAEIMLWKLEN